MHINENKNPLTNKQSTRNSNWHQGTGQKSKNENQKLSDLPSTFLSGRIEKERILEDSQKAKNDAWSQGELRRLFSLYSQFGSRWKMFESELSNKSANSIKNKFYTSVRNFLKKLFALIVKQIPRRCFQVPSIVILKFFESREEFRKYKKLSQKLLAIMKRGFESQNLEEVVKEYFQQIQAIYELISNNVTDKCHKRFSRKIDFDQTNQLKSPTSFQKKVEDIEAGPAYGQDHESLLFKSRGEEVEKIRQISDTQGPVMGQSSQECCFYYVVPLDCQSTSGNFFLYYNISGLS